jgi:hypothetical protein
VQAQERLPGAVQRHRLGRAVLPLAGALEVRDDQAVALPGGDLDPRGVVDGVGRGELHGDVRRARVGLHVLEGEGGLHVVGHGRDQAVGDRRGHGQQARHEDGARDGRAGEPAAQAEGQQCTEQAAGDTADDGHERALDGDVAVPRQRLHDLGPAGLGQVAERPDQQTRDRAERERATGGGEGKGQQLDQQSRAQVERQGRRDLAEARAHDEADAAADDHEEQRGSQAPPRPHPHPGGDERDPGRCRRS